MWPRAGEGHGHLRPAIAPEGAARIAARWHSLAWSLLPRATQALRPTEQYLPRPSQQCAACPTLRSPARERCHPEPHEAQAPPLRQIFCCRHLSTHPSGPPAADESPSERPCKPPASVQPTGGWWFLVWPTAPSLAPDQKPKGLCEESALISASSSQVSCSFASRNGSARPLSGEGPHDKTKRRVAALCDASSRQADGLGRAWLDGC